MEALRGRYPDIAFLLSVFPYKKGKLPRKEKPFLEWLSTQNLEEVELLYIGGLVGFPLPKSLFDWLEGRKERALVFLENDLGAFAAFDDESLFDHPQIHFHYFEENPYDDLAGAFPTERVAIYMAKPSLPLDPETLLRKSAAISALFSDVLYSHFLVENILTNYGRLEGSFAANHWKGRFKGIPAVICGAGPSLEKAIPTLKEMGDRALIFGCGSAITALSNKGVRQHFAMALDPNLEEVDRLRQSTYFEGPFLFAPRLHRDVFATTNGPFGFMKTDTGGMVENWLEEKCGFDDPPIGPDLGPEAFSVTTLAVSYALALGCNPIIFDGVDLAYTGGKRYASGVEAEASAADDPRALEKVLIRKDIHGNEVETLLKWVMEADAIGAFAKANPTTHFLNATDGGLGFAGIKNTPLEKALEKAPTKDLFGFIHQMIQENPLQIEAGKVESLVQQLKESLTTCETLCNQILKTQNGRNVLYQTDLEEEPAYIALLSGIDSALSRIIPRYFPTLDIEEGKKTWETAKYRELLSQIQKFNAILRKQRAYSSAS